MFSWIRHCGLEVCAITCALLVCICYIVPSRALSVLGQMQLNSAATCHVHKDRLDQVNVQGVTRGLINRTKTHRDAFGGF